jgi:putative transposase
MQHSRFSEQQIAFVLEQVARGAAVEQTCRAAGISAQTYYRWRAKYAGLKPAEIRRLHEIEEENKRLKRLVATLLVVKPSPGAGALTHARAALPALLPAPAPASAAVPAAAPLGMNRYWGPLSTYLPTLPKHGRLNMPAPLRAVLKGMRNLTTLRSKIQGPLPARRAAPGLGAKALMALRARKLLLICFAGGLVGGFAIGLGPDAGEDRGPETVPVNMNLRVDSYAALTNTMEKGWSGSQSWGRWMEGARASILLGFDGPALGDVELLLEGRARLAEGQPDHTLIVRFNDAELGRWRLPKETRQLRRRFIVPGAVFNRNTAAQLTFELAEKAPLSPVFGLEAVSLRDAKFLHEYKGFVDNCSNGTLMGWAVAEGVAVSVAASVGDEPLAATLSNKERPDLAAHGLPADAGFELTFTQPVPAGSAIEVRFANGRPLSGSPCKP